MTGISNDFLALVKEMLENFGVENGVTQRIVGTLALLSIVYILIRQLLLIVNYFVSKRKNRILAKDLHPFYSEKEIKNATKFYIKTKFQNRSPSENENSTRKVLIPFFLNKAFKKNLDDNKYYLILADSGMGKTTFMINLYLAYKFKRNTFWQRSNHNIKLFPLAHPKTMERIELMPPEEKEKTILLLDAFDEDNQAVKNYKERLNELLSKFWEFREVVITCRTQFFPSSKDVPVETGDYKYGTESGQYSFQKIYVSVFSKTDIKKYLNKKFGTLFSFKTSRHLKALGIVLKTPNLMMRPMLLSHVDDLVKVNKNLKYSFQIYEILINEWFNRESNKPGVIKKYGSNYKHLLRSFSRALAKELYKRKIKSGKLSLKVNEIIDNPNGLQLTDIEGDAINIDKYDQGSRSLLNRNALGEYKFSHKSILEYFLAHEVIYDKNFRDQFNFDSDLDTAKLFFFEMLIDTKSRKQSVESLFTEMNLDYAEFEKFKTNRNSAMSNKGINYELFKASFWDWTTKTLVLISTLLIAYLICVTLKVFVSNTLVLLWVIAGIALLTFIVIIYRFINVKKELQR